MKILITGARGQLGLVVAREFARGHVVVPLAMADLDVTDHAAVMARVVAERPDVIVNCAAWNDVDGAEERPLEALKVNSLAVGSLSRAASEQGAILVHYSTDFVFDGAPRDRPYTEDDLPQPQSVYASSKLLGDWFAMETPRHYVLRVESLFGASAEENFCGRSSVDRIIDTLAAGGAARVFTDRIVSPSYVVDVTLATRQLVERGAPFGLYHSVNTGSCTWYELAQEVARYLPGAGTLVPVSVDEVRLRASRPRFAALSNAKLASAGVVMPTWQQAVARYLALRVPCRSAGEDNG
jgi:dTDP-4-dehydrorhamnose reductase